MDAVPSLEFLRRLGQARLPVTLDTLSGATDRDRFFWSRIRAFLHDVERRSPSIVRVGKLLGLSPEQCFASVDEADKPAETHQFDPSLFGPALPRSVERERALAEQLRLELVKHGRFERKGRRFYFRAGRRAMAVSLKPGTTFGRLITRAVGVSIRSPMVHRAAEAVVESAQGALELSKG